MLLSGNNYILTIILLLLGSNHIFIAPIYCQDNALFVKVKFENLELNASVPYRIESTGQLRRILIVYPDSLGHQKIDSELDKVINLSTKAKKNIVVVLAFSNLITTDSIILYNSCQINGYLVYLKSKKGYKTRVYKKVINNLQEIKELRTFNSHVFCSVAENLDSYLRPLGVPAGVVFIFMLNDLNNVLPYFKDNLNIQLNKLITKQLTLEH